ncbi:MAG: hypothetical protein AAF492_31000 [Verrucomicrobiota bacterium]
MAISTGMVHGALLVAYEFDQASDAPSARNNNISAGDFYLNTPFVEDVPFAPGVRRSAGWTGSPTIDLDEYWGFTITVQPQTVIDLTSLNFSLRSNVNGPRSWAVRTSLDNFGADLASGAISQTLTPFAIGLTDSNLIGTIEFRLYEYNAVIGDSGGSSTRSSLGGIELQGNVTHIPEPSVFALILAGVVAIRRWNMNRCG